LTFHPLSRHHPKWKALGIPRTFQSIGRDEKNKT
jgi:hypothetical protein